jgi:MFS family permease
VVLVIAALGWLFDTMDQSLFNLVRAPSLRELLHPHLDRPSLTPEEAARLADGVKHWSGITTSVFLVGWATGGFLFGILGDRLGRTRTMIVTILIYATFTALSGAVHDVWLYSLMRFATALGVGGEWAAGASLVAEVFPERSRPMALGLLQGLSTVGNMAASVVTWGLGDLDQRWRWAYFVGAVPALLVVWIRGSVREPDSWKAARERASVGRELGNFAELFRRPDLRRNTIAAVLMATAGVGSLWGITFFSPELLREELLVRGHQAPKVVGQVVSLMFFLYNAGSFFGIYLFAAFSERFTRRSAFFLWFTLAWASVLTFFWTVSGTGEAARTIGLVQAPILGFCTLGLFSGYAVYFPYLFPTRLRATGCGFCYNFARYLAAAAPWGLGGLSAALAVKDSSGTLVRSGYAPAATFVSGVYLLGYLGTYLGPETKGQPLPEDAPLPRAEAYPSGTLGSGA